MSLKLEINAGIMNYDNISKQVKADPRQGTIVLEAVF